MPNKKQYQKYKQLQIDYFIKTLGINGTDAELLYSITRENEHNATKPIINYRLKRFASKRHKTYKHIKKLYRCFLEHSAKELNKKVITALLIRRSNKDNLIMQECDLIDTIESYKSLLKIDALIGKERGRIKDLQINFYYDDIESTAHLKDNKKVVLIENYGEYYHNRVIITKRNPKNAENESLEYQDISAILGAKKRQQINNKIVDAIFINE